MTRVVSGERRKINVSYYITNEGCVCLWSWFQLTYWGSCWPLCSLYSKWGCVLKDAREKASGCPVTWQVPIKQETYFISFLGRKHFLHYIINTLCIIIDILQDCSFISFNPAEIILTTLISAISHRYCWPNERFRTTRAEPDC